MKASEGRVGRVFVIRLEDGDVVPGCIEQCAKEKGVSVGHAILVGGVGGGEVVVGPWRSEERPLQPMLLPVDGAHPQSLEEGMVHALALRPAVFRRLGRVGSGRYRYAGGGKNEGNSRRT